MIENNFSSNALNSVYNSIEYITTFFDNYIEIIITDLTYLSRGVFDLTNMNKITKPLL